MKREATCFSAWMTAFIKEMANTWRGNYEPSLSVRKENELVIIPRAAFDRRMLLLWKRIIDLACTSGRFRGKHRRQPIRQSVSAARSNNKSGNRLFYVTPIEIMLEINDSMNWTWSLGKFQTINLIYAKLRYFLSFKKYSEIYVFHYISLWYVNFSVLRNIAKYIYFTVICCINFSVLRNIVKYMCFTIFHYNI